MRDGRIVEAGPVAQVLETRRGVHPAAAGRRAAAQRGRPVTRRGLVCAHRGASLDLPDNSLEAFVAAIAAGADVIETDVRRAPDGTLVLAHDPWDIVEGVVELAALVDLARGRVGLDLEIVEQGLERQLLDVVDGFTDWLIVTSTYPDVLRRCAA